MKTTTNALRRFRRLRRGIPAGALALALSLAAPAARAADAHAKELAQRVEIRRDEWGVPHILAPTQEAAALAFGYCQAEDYPDLLPRLFTAARGEMARYFGEANEKADLELATFNIYQDSVDRFSTLRPDLQAQLDAFAAGYNLWLERQTDPKPWMKPIDGPTVLSHARRVVAMEFTYRIGRMFKPDAPAKTALAPAPARGREFEVASAGDGGAGAVGEPYMPHSNMWAIGKGRSATGHGLLLANPHLSWSGSQTFYEAHITIPGLQNISGCTLIGSPGVTIGFNEFLGWSHTVNIFDSVDTYELKMDPANPDHYLYDGRSVPLRKREVAIQVLTAEGKTETRNHTILESHFGPVSKEADGSMIATKIPNRDDIAMLDQWNQMGLARNLREFRAALDMQGAPMFNICYTDREGNTFYIYNGRIPKRNARFDYSDRIPGDTSLAEWTIVHPEADLPQLLNPPSAYTQNCNDAPWYTNKGSILDKSLYPNYMARDGVSLRTQNSVGMLEADASITLDEVKAYKFSTKMLAAERFKDDLVAILEAAPEKSADMTQAISLLKDWNNVADRASRASMLFRQWFSDYPVKVEKPYVKPWTAAEPYSTPSGIADAKEALAAMERSITKMKETYGRIDPAWGDVNRIVRGEKSFAADGDTGQFGFFRVLTMANAPKDKAKVAGERRAVGGDSYVAAVEFTDPPTAWTIVAYSQTERADSPHFADQTELFARHEFKRAWFTEDDVKAHAARTYHPGE